MSDPARLFIALYTDEDITSELAPALRERGFEAQSAGEVGLLQAADAQQLAYAAEHGLTLLTCNAAHFLMLARQYAQAGQTHAGIIISSEQYSRRRFGELLRLTLRVVNTLTVDDMRNAVVYLQQFK
jgi:predicted nuclease of predicted toxin-antitoxin system